MHRNFDYRKTVTRRSSWSDQALASRRFAHFYRSAKRPVQKEKTGCSSIATSALQLFLREELDNYQREKFLTRCDCAWSRDSAEKSYVQHKMLNGAEEIWKWMDGEGAHFFVCGDARRMAKDVDAALRKVIQDKGGKTEEQTNEYVENSKQINGTSATCIRK